MVRAYALHLAVVMLCVVFCFFLIAVSSAHAAANSTADVNNSTSGPCYDLDGNLSGCPTTPSSSAVPTLTPECDKLFGLSAGSAAWDNKYLTPELCKADQDLISRYTVGSCSGKGLSSPQTQGITKLNPAFAIALDKMLNQPAMKGLTIVSAYRTPEAQACANDKVGDSSHEHGCAVDLGYSQSSCSSVQCQWVRTNARAFGLQMRLPYSPEFNHIEPVNLAACKAGTVVPPVATGVVTNPVGNGAGAAPPNCPAGKTCYVCSGNACTKLSGGASIGSGCTIQGNLRVCDASNPFGSNLFGGSSGMSQMMLMMLGMQLGQGLGSALGNAFNSTSNTTPTAAAPAPLPPLPPPVPLPTIPTPSGSSTIDALIAALNGTNPATTTPPPPPLNGTTSIGQIQSTSTPQCATQITCQQGATAEVVGTDGNGCPIEQCSAGSTTVQCAVGIQCLQGTVAQVSGTDGNGCPVRSCVLATSTNTISVGTGSGSVLTDTLSAIRDTIAAIFNAIVNFFAGGSANTADAVQGQDIVVGTGAQAQPGDTVSVLYTGYIGQISSSTMFDSSAAHGDQPLTFTLGTGGLIPGFQIGINGMKVGGERLLSIPPSLGYSAQAITDASTSAVIIPANSTLIFDVQLLDAQPGTTTATTTGP